MNTKIKIVAGLLVSVVIIRFSLPTKFPNVSPINPVNPASTAIPRTSPNHTATPAPAKKTSGPKTESIALGPPPPARRGEQIYHALTLPNDSYYSSQWYLPKIVAPSAWDITTGQPTITIAVIDTGFALSHQDLQNKWATNSGESSFGRESNGIDDDHNGYVDDWRGWDFVHNDNYPQAGTTNPNGQFVFHGTLTSGVIGAQSNNGTGISGVNWQSKILPLQVLSDDGYGYTSDVAAAIRYAADRGAGVISLSLGAPNPDPAVENAIDYAESRGAVVVAAAGNDGCDCMLYPANYPDVIAVGASDSSDGKASFSSYGTNLDLVAPGVGSIFSTSYTAQNPTSAYGSADGTSLSTPMVAGAVGLIKALRPEASSYQVIQALLAGVDRPPGMGTSRFSPNFGYGRLDIEHSLELIKLIPLAPALISQDTVSASSSSPLTTVCQSQPGAFCKIDLIGPSTSVQNLFSGTVDSNGQITGQWSPAGTGLAPGNWEVVAIAQSSNFLAPSTTHKFVVTP